MMKGALRCEAVVMAAPVRDKYGFIRRMNAIRKLPAEQRPSLIGFVLYDDRLSHRVVQDFARRQYDWLDSLARNSDMVLFMFLPNRAPLPPGPSRSQVLVAEADDTPRNPSLDIARRFGLGPSDLPGIVFFTELDPERVGRHDGVFCPLQVELFEETQTDAEVALAHLFSLVHEAQDNAAKSGDLLAELRSGIDTAKSKSGAEAPVLSALGPGVLRLVTFVGSLAQTYGTAFLQQLGKQTAEGNPPLPPLTI